MEIWERFGANKRKAQKVTAAFLGFLMLTGFVYAVVTVTISNTLTVVSAGLTANPNSFVWGNVVRGSTYSKTSRITNVDSVAHTLSMTDDLNPSIGTLDWDQEDTILQPGAFVDATFTLTVDASGTLGAGSFTITITG